MKERVLWAIGGAVFILVISLIFGGVYTITPPNGPVDTAYMMNRFTGKVWLIKTYSKQVGQMRVLAARRAEVEQTRELNSDADLPAVAMQQEQSVPASRAGRR
jgi:hypothetical protein